MMACSQRPKCHKTKARKCIVPNPWISFITAHSGKGYSREYLSSEYKRWKRKTFRYCGMSSRKAHVEKRRALLCDIFAPNATSVKRKTPGESNSGRKVNANAATRARKTPGESNRGRQTKATPVIKPRVATNKRPQVTPRPKTADDGVNRKCVSSAPTTKCNLSLDHVRLIKKSFGNVKGPVGSQDVCDYLSREVFQLPSGCTVYRFVSGGEATDDDFVYSGVLRSSNVHVRVVKLRSPARQGLKKKEGIRVTEESVLSEQHARSTNFKLHMDDVLFTSTVVGRPRIVKSHGLSYSIHSAVEGRTLKSLMDKHRHELLQRVGSIFADIHEKGSHGNAQLSNIIYQPNKEVALTSLHRSVVFTEKHSIEQKLNCRMYDVMKIVQSLSIECSPDWKENNNYRSFISSYTRRFRENLGKKMSQEDVSDVMKHLGTMLGYIFDNTTPRGSAINIDSTSKVTKRP